MNPLFWILAIVSTVLFWLGQVARRRCRNPAQRIVLWALAMGVAAPGIVFALYYTGLLGEPIWLYRFRSLPGTELTAAGLGFLGGVLHSARESWPRFRKLTSRTGVAFFFVLALCVPYLKLWMLPLHPPASSNGWSNGVCRQSTSSTCGPASAATLAKLAGVELDEHALARECFTSERGTENWYLARALRRHGLTAQFLELNPAASELPHPAIAGVKLTYGTGHFIPILGREGTNYIIGDPMQGREVKSLAELREEYQFTGFFLIVK